MPISTMTGDDGTTALFGGERVLKSDLRIELCGELDELTCRVGSARNGASDEKDTHLCDEIQNSLYLIMAYVSGSTYSEKKLSSTTSRVHARIHEVEKKLPPLRRFVLPQGQDAALKFHLARTAARKTERLYVRVARELRLIDAKKSHLQFLNRMSDYFFLLARLYGDADKLT